MGGLISDSNIKELLKDMGMTDYESEIYSTLLDRGVCTAKQISEFSGVPVTRVYETLKDMEGEGLVSVLEERPKKYKITSIKSLENLVKEKEEKLEKEVKRAKETFKKIKNKSPEPSNSILNDNNGSFWLLRSRDIGIETFKELIQDTEKELLVFSGDLSWIPEQIDVLKSLSERGINIKLLHHTNRPKEENIQKLQNLNIRLQTWDGVARGHIIDDKKALLVFKTPREGVNEEDYTGVPGTEELFKYDRIITSNPKFVKMMRKYFNFFWNQDD